MIWVRCITCGFVHEHYIRETVAEWKNFLYNRDNTYTSLIEPDCLTCNNPASFNERLQKERSKLVDKEYQHLLVHELKEKRLHFESPLEDYFWKAWRTTFPHFKLIPQYQIGKYYVDFADLPSKTAIEIDGKLFHTAANQKADDQVRQKNIEKQGWRFIRFQGGDIHYHVDRCIVKLLYFLSQIYGEDLIGEARFQWDLSPSIRLLLSLKEKYEDKLDGFAELMTYCP
jgi:very-short-patch-repair endonuclease